ncbi:uncharacterized protein PHACADRAFT_253410 [Phanerochaete carnosa HHB-10118-sp]|uniref:Uncharacterized protein n=1 Tax=Phanerochaete carnosa (strain HHB-10118-sp) TaxID=650164 RepID=K5WAX6_PHACS|nr:uncharacterized protein PHACADRAFT_253410 [Phanerochaete carnosa HHB-10118-sp]EKM56340.1 hypothetical protein PHACADRAFT_253410 [Phanerochaete carnosa HHB-10118-sp]
MTPFSLSVPFACTRRQRRSSSKSRWRSEPCHSAQRQMFRILEADAAGASANRGKIECDCAEVGKGSRRVAQPPPEILENSLRVLFAESVGRCMSCMDVSLLLLFVITAISDVMLVAVTVRVTLLPGW